MVLAEKRKFLPQHPRYPRLLVTPSPGMVHQDSAHTLPFCSRPVSRCFVNQGRSQGELNFEKGRVLCADHSVTASKVKRCLNQTWRIVNFTPCTGCLLFQHPKSFFRTELALGAEEVNDKWRSSLIQHLDDVCLADDLGQSASSLSDPTARRREN